MTSTAQRPQRIYLKGDVQGIANRSGEGVVNDAGSTWKEQRKQQRAGDLAPLPEGISVGRVLYGLTAGLDIFTGTAHRVAARQRHSGKEGDQHHAHPFFHITTPC